MKVTRILAILLTVLLGIYSVSWLAVARHVKQRLEAGIVEINQSQKNQTKISYEAINLAGFPFNVQLNIINPLLEGHVAAKNVKIGMDKISLQSNFIGGRYQLKLGQKSTSESGDVVMSCDSREDEVNLSLAKSGISVLWPKTVDEFWQQLDNVKLSLNGGQCKDKSGNVVLDSYGGFIEFNKENNRYEVISKNAFQAFNSKGESIFGKTSSDIDFELLVNKPDDKSRATIALNFKKYEYSSDQGSLSLSGDGMFEVKPFKLVKLGYMVKIGKYKNIFTRLSQQINPSVIEVWEELILKLATINGNQENLSINIVSTPEIGVMIGSMSIKDIMLFALTKANAFKSQ